MNKQIKKFVKQSGLEIHGLGKDKVKWDYTVNQFAELIIKDCIQHIDKDIDRLYEYRKSLSDDEESFRNDVDICISKCLDIMQGLRDRYGVDE